jgi:plasmid maintenance system antidote protein VapI
MEAILCERRFRRNGLVPALGRRATIQTSAEFRLNLQTAYDLRIAAREGGGEIAKQPTRPAPDNRPKRSMSA